MPRDGSAPSPGDADSNLVPRIVRALVLPTVLAVVERIWNPMSQRESIAVAAMLSELMIYVDPESEGLVKVVKATMARLQGAIQVVYVPSWPPAAVAATKKGEVYLLRSFGRALRLLRCISAFNEVLPGLPLQQLAVQQLAQQKLLPVVRSAAASPEVLAERAERLIDALPGAWVRAGVPRGLEGLVDVVQAGVRSLEMAAGQEEKRAAKAPAAAGLARVLEKLGDAAAARRLRLMFDVVV